MTAHRNARLEALCDGVFAIAMTLLILDISLHANESISSTAELWHALRRLGPAILAFILSFGVIFITWVNHRAMMEGIRDSSASFLYANGFLLLTVVSLPFPTGLLGTFLLTDHAAPAVVLYNAVNALLAIGWILVSDVALRDRLTVNEQATAATRVARRNGYGAFTLYTVLAITALWFPLATAVVTTASWIFWLVLGIRLRRA